jgi:hypothetical protein
VNPGVVVVVEGTVVGSACPSVGDTRAQLGSGSAQASLSALVAAQQVGVVNPGGAVVVEGTVVGAVVGFPSVGDTRLNLAGSAQASLSALFPAQQVGVVNPGGVPGSW